VGRYARSVKPFDPREPAPFALVVLLGFVVARFLGVAVHEVAGHGLFAVATGGAFYGTYISPGSGFALIYLPPTVPDAASAAVALAGILVQLVLGVLLWRLAPRARTFLGRLFLLLLVEVFVVYSFIYLGLGALGGTGGDSAGAAAILGAPHLVPAFVFVGIAWASAIAFRISRELIALVAPGASRRQEVLYLSLFWFTPFVAGAVPSLVFSGSLSQSLILYALLFVGVGGAVFALSALLAARFVPVRTSPPERPVGRVSPLVVAFLVVLPAWLVPFGPTDGTAHGVLFAEPPVEAERFWANPVAINVRAGVDASLNATLEFRFKGAPVPRSPLEQAVADTYEERADLAYWTDGAIQLAITITNVSSWTVAYAGIEASGAVWVAGQIVSRPRLVVLTPLRPEDNARLVAVVQAASTRYVRLTLRDPWQYDPRTDCPTCFLDEVNVTWSAAGPLRLVQVVQRDGYASRLSGYDAAMGTEFVRFRNSSADDPPRAYDLRWELRA